MSITRKSPTTMTLIINAFVAGAALCEGVVYSYDGIVNSDLGAGMSGVFFLACATLCIMEAMEQKQEIDKVLRSKGKDKGE